jgi:hypothetical protein
MNSKIILYLFTFTALFFIGFQTHTFFIEKAGLELPYNLHKIYLFHAGFSALVCVNLSIFSNVDKVFEQLGFVYLATLFFKIILYCIVFYKSIFTEDNLTRVEAISQLIPMFLFLLTEVIFVAKILNKKTPKTIK